MLFQNKKGAVEAMSADSGKKEDPFSERARESRRDPVFERDVMTAPPLLRYTSLTCLIACALILGLAATADLPFIGAGDKPAPVTSTLGPGIQEPDTPEPTPAQEKDAGGGTETAADTGPAPLEWDEEIAPALDFDTFYGDVYAPAEVSQSYRVERGDTLMDVLLKAGLERREAHRAISALSGKFNMRRLKIGHKVIVAWAEQPDGSRRLRSVSLVPDATKRIEARLDNEGKFVLEEEVFELARHDYFAAQRIDSSLYLAAREVEIPNPVIVDLIRIFSFDVDFQREIRKGDSFEVYYHRYHDSFDRPVKEGDIDYAKLTLRGEPHRLYRFTPSDTGRTEYFDENGQSARRLLMKTPVDGARLTSRFGMRHHPVLGYSRMHKGLDFGARSGTPIMAAGDGVIEKSRRYGGYGRYVQIRHNSQYQTAYAHLSGYGPGIKEGRRVKQGQIIGYVGASGLATGPHLHYEVHSNGGQVNPLTLKFPSGRKLEGDVLAQFRERVRDLDGRVAQLSGPTKLAAAECEDSKGC